MKYLHLRLLSCCFLLIATSPLHCQVQRSDPTTIDSAYVQARAAFDRGDFDKTIAILEQGSRQREEVPDQLKRSILLADGYLALGRSADAIRILGSVSRNARNEPENLILLEDRLATAYRLFGQLDRAALHLNSALEAANSLNRPDLRAMVLNDLGTIQADSEDLESAIRSFTASLDLARDAELDDAQLVAGMNQTAAFIRYGRIDGLDKQLAENAVLIGGVPTGYKKAQYLLALGSQYSSAQRSFGFDSSWRLRAYEAYQLAVTTARTIEQPRLASYGLGFIGRLYADEHRDNEALLYTRLATIEAEKTDALDVLYLWQWQRARILSQQGSLDLAIPAYRQAISTIDDIRSILPHSSTSFQTLVGPVFTEFADLLLRRASAAVDDRGRQKDLEEVLNTIENLNRAEVAEYFHDDCVVQRHTTTGLAQLANDVAVVYPLMFPDRIEVVLRLRGSLKVFSVPVPVPEITSVIRDFRQNLETLDSKNAFMRPARRLYTLLIKPIENDLRAASVTTIVFVPEGALRTIPLAALHDGESFLVEKYAVVTTPGLTLTSQSSASPTDVRTLAAGLTTSVQGFRPLPNIKSELNAISSLFPTTLLEDRNFSAMKIESSVSRGNFSVVHLATHGVFDRDHSKSFLLTVDGKLTMDDLQSAVANRKYSDTPLELLVLSACETANGDDRAALGLAGVGLKAGSKSVVATLWPINDKSTASLIEDFYRQLKDAKNTKAQALRVAQLELMKQEQFRHPFFWAPFLLIGNWQ